MVDTIKVLAYLCKLGACDREILLSTGALADEIGVSQQSASRILQEMEDQQLITRDPSYQGIRVKLTEKSNEELKKMYQFLSTVYGAVDTVKGEVVDGIGEAAWYVEKYAHKIKESVGFFPYFGTLNLKVDSSAMRKLLENAEEVRIEEFTKDKRTYGGVTIIPLLVSEVKAAILKPDRTRYGNSIVEIVSGVNLRKKLQVKKGSEVALSLG